MAGHADTANELSDKATGEDTAEESDDSLDELDAEPTTARRRREHRSRTQTSNGFSTRPCTGPILRGGLLQDVHTARAAEANHMGQTDFGALDLPGPGFTP